MMIVLGPSERENAERYAGILSRIECDPTRFGELPPVDLAFCCDLLHRRLLWLTVQMDRLGHTDHEREAAITCALNTDAGVLARRAEISMALLQAGEALSLRDWATWWVTECSIKTHMEVELERRTAFAQLRSADALLRHPARGQRGVTPRLGSGVGGPLYAKDR